MNTQTPDMPKICTNLQELLVRGDLAGLQLLMDESILLYNEQVLPAINQVLSRPANVSLLIQSILNKPIAFEAVRKGSYCHENGFHKIVLLQGKYFKLRLHHFGATGKVAMENIHDHRWPFASSILKGDLHMDLFELCDPGEAAEHEELLLHHVYHSDKSSGAYQANLQGVANLKRVQRVCFPEGFTYLLLPDALHRIVNEQNQESITLILTGKPVSNTCNLYARRTITQDEKQTPAYPAQSLRQQLQRISEIIYPKNN